MSLCKSTLAGLPPWVETGTRPSRSSSHWKRADDCQPNVQPIIGQLAHGHLSSEIFSFSQNAPPIFWIFVGVVATLAVLSVIGMAFYLVNWNL
jgi:hypothetical protein